MPVRALLLGTALFITASPLAVAAQTTRAARLVVTVVDPSGGRVAGASVRLALDTHVYNLRQKIEPVPERPVHLPAVRGLGYRFDLEP